MDNRKSIFDFENGDFDLSGRQADLNQFMKAGFEGVVISLFINSNGISNMSIEVTFN